MCGIAIAICASRVRNGTTGQATSPGGPRLADHRPNLCCLCSRLRCQCRFQQSGGPADTQAHGRPAPEVGADQSGITLVGGNPRVINHEICGRDRVFNFHEQALLARLQLLKALVERSVVLNGSEAAGVGLRA